MEEKKEKRVLQIELDDDVYNPRLPYYQYVCPPNKCPSNTCTSFYV